jgi:hypothetical protein
MPTFLAAVLAGLSLNEEGRAPEVLRVEAHAVACPYEVVEFL